MNLYVHVFAWTYVIISVSAMLRSRSVGPMVFKCSAFGDTAKEAAGVAISFHILTSTGWVPLSPHPPPCLVRLVYSYSHWSWCVAVFHCGFNFISLMTNDV